MSSPVQPPSHHEAIPGVPEPIEQTGSSVMSLSAEMVVLTWLAFIVAAVVLKKFLWKPLLGFLEAREDEIRTSLDKAEQAKKSLAATQDEQAAMIAQAKVDAKSQSDQIVAQARAQAEQMTATTKSQLQQQLEDSQQRLDHDRAQAITQLKATAGDELCAAMERILPRLLSPEQKQAYQEQIIQDLTLPQL